MLNPSGNLPYPSSSTSSPSLNRKSSSSSASVLEAQGTGSPGKTALVAQYQEFNPGVPFSPPSVLGQGVQVRREFYIFFLSGKLYLIIFRPKQITLRSWDSEWSSSVDVPLRQATGTVAYNYLSLKQVSRASRNSSTNRQQVSDPFCVYFPVLSVQRCLQRGQSRDRKCQYDLGVIMKPCEAPFQRTSLLTFVPRYVLVNRLEVPLEYSQTGYVSDNYH